jgi:hypothetical protein
MLRISNRILFGRPLARAQMQTLQNTAAQLASVGHGLGPFGPRQAQSATLPARTDTSHKSHLTIVRHTRPSSSPPNAVPLSSPTRRHLPHPNPAARCSPTPRATTGAPRRRARHSRPLSPPPRRPFPPPIQEDPTAISPARRPSTPPIGATRRG